MVDVVRDHQRRKCLGCGKRDAKENLLRFVFQDGQLVLDNKQVAQARGAYVHNTEHCLEKVKSFRLWEKSLKLVTGSIQSLPDLFEDKNPPKNIKRRPIRL